MAIEEQILKCQLERDVFYNATFSGARGIAERAVSNGFNSLSPKQKVILEPYLSKTCSGAVDPGGNRNNCSTELNGETLLDAYNRADDVENLVCDDCYSEEGYYSHQWERIEQE